MGCESPAVSCPIRTASISGVRGGNESQDARMEKPRPPDVETRRGGSDRGGEQTYEPEHKGMTAAPKKLAGGKSLAGSRQAPTRSEIGGGRCPGGRNGSEHSRGSRSKGPGTQGRGHVPALGRATPQQGLTA